MTKSPSGVLLGEQAPPRIRHAPRVRANSWEDVADLAASFGIRLDPWQENVLQAGMGERHDGTWAARQVAVSAPRQNGKSELIVARALAGLLLFGEKTIIISAHQQDTAREVFQRITGLVDDYPALGSRVSAVLMSVGREYIRFKSGQVLRLKTRSSGSGRGYSCDCLLLDEAQILGAAAWSAMLPTMSARPNPQAWLMGTPPTDADDGEVFERIRALGLAGVEPRIAYLEWAAERDDPLDDPGTWAKANPFFPSRISHEAIASELASMSEGQFRLERLGIWSQTADGPVIDPVLWAGLVDSVEDGRPPDSLGVSMSHGGDISVAACWRDGDRVHAEEVWAGAMVVGAVSWIAARAGRRIPVVIDGADPASALLPELRSRRVAVSTTTASDMARACGLMTNWTEVGLLTHGGQESVTNALLAARKKPIRDAGGWGWDRRQGSVDMAPLVAFTMAVFGASSSHRPPPAGRRRGREAMVI